MPNNTQPTRECVVCGEGPLSIREAFRGVINSMPEIMCETCYHGENNESTNDSDCYDNDNNDHYTETINNYGYHPSAIFYTGRNTRTEDTEYTTKTPCFGVELETEQPRPDYDNLRRAASNAMNSSEGFVYIKDDCSLREGFECVSHPATLDYWQNHSQGYQEMLVGLRKKGFRAWTTSRCGLHIHISKNSFINPMHEMKFIYFIFRNKETMVNLVGRNSPFGQYNLDSFLGIQNNDEDDEYRNHNWSATHPKPTLIEIAKGRRKDGSRVSQPVERNLAVNRLNRETYELRIFRPSLLFATVLSYIEFTHCLFEYTKIITSNDIMRHEAISKFEGLANFARNNRETYPNFIWKMHNRPDVSKAPDGWIDNPHKNKKKEK